MTGQSILGQSSLGQSILGRPTLRLRLTLIYGGLFLAAGAVLLTLSYAMVRRGLDNQNGPVGVRIDALTGSGVAAGSGVAGVAGDELGFTRPVPDPSTVVTADGRTLDKVLADYQAQLRDSALHQLVVQSSIALGVMALASVGVGWMVAGRALRPLSRVTATARRLSGANLHERLALDGPDDELKELADTFDAMLGRLEAAFESQRRFVANASHELRTPVSIQRTLVDVALADPGTSPEDLRAMAVAVGDAADRSERLIDGLLVLARSERGDLPEEPVDVADVAAAALDQIAAEAAAADLRVERDLHAAPTTGSRVLLERLVGNLVQNAVRHNRRGGWLRVRTTTEGSRATVSVANGGVALDPDQVPALFEPFRRLSADGRQDADRVDSSRGVGLGLSIVRAVAVAHGGQVQAEPLGDGGLVVKVGLPLRGGHPPEQVEEHPAVVGREGREAGHVAGTLVVDPVVVRLP
jgi:signal transduction histidine kinase